jgi:hypothetical protein
LQECAFQDIRMWHSYFTPWFHKLHSCTCFPLSPCPLAKITLIPDPFPKDGEGEIRACIIKDALPN